MNILITGAAGFIGRYLSKYLESKYNVYNLVSRQKKTKIKNEIVIDLRDKAKVKKFFNNFRKRNRVDIIVHLASRLVGPESVKDISLFYDNLKITEAIVDISRLLHPAKIINFSSIAVYPNKTGFYNEKSEIRPSVNTEGLYGLSKFCSENLLDIMLKNTDTCVTHLRIAQVYGDGMRSDRVMSMMRKELIERNTITVYGNGVRESNFLLLEDLGKKLELFLENNAPGICNIGGERLSYLDLAKRIILKDGRRGSRIIKKNQGSREKFILDTRKYKELEWNV